MNTYPEMNKLIVGLLRISDNPVDLYAAQYIEELQKRVPKRPHGRLIDADALANSEDCKRKGCVYQEEIFRAPTVIPASEGGE